MIAHTSVVGLLLRVQAAWLEACLVLPPGFVENVAAVANSELAPRGQALIRSLLRSWEDPESAVVPRSIFLIAAQHPLALERLRLIVSRSLIGAVATNLDDDRRLLRGGLVGPKFFD